MKVAVLVFLSLLATRALAAEIALTLMSPSGAVAPGSVSQVDLLAINPSGLSAPAELPSRLPGRLTVNGVGHTLELSALGATSSMVSAGGFVARRYEFTLPADAVGQAVMEVNVDGHSPLRAVLDIRGDTARSGTKPTELGRLAASVKVEEAVVNRTFAGRLTPNDPIYFIYGGGKQSAAKFQFSFNYRLATFDWENGERERSANLLLGYTQRSLWDIDASSSPFYDTSYMPEVSLDLPSTVSAKGSGWFTWIGLRAGVMHESNGRSGDGSRSLNIAYVRPMFALGPLDSWHLVVFPDISGYLTGIDENENLKDYRGYGRLRMVFGKNNGPSLLFAGWMGKDFDHATYQLDLAYPIRTKLLNIESFLLLQYFDGYGESLLSYDKKSSALRLGVALLR